MSTSVTAIEQQWIDPEFGDGVAPREAPCTPRELFCNLFLEPEEHVHYWRPAYAFVRHALANATPPELGSGGASEFVAELVAWGKTSERAPLPDCGSSWPVRVAREFGPLGLSDGAWLKGAVQANAIESQVGMSQLKQLMIRFGDPGSREAYAQRYNALLRSLGVPPEGLTRWDWDEALPCTEISYEHALLGLTLGLFPTTLRAEALGYNLWMAAIGPCPLLESLTEVLREQRQACLRYIELYDRDTLSTLAARAVCQALEEPGGSETRERVARGFVAAQRSYERWERAMLGNNVPLTARDFVLEGIRRKARFAAEHHGDVQLSRCNVQSLLLAGGEAHERLLDHMAASPLIKKGSPGSSRFMTHALSIDGPMFDAFTPAEKNDLNEWIASLAGDGGVREKPVPVPLDGYYSPPDDPASLGEHIMASYVGLSLNELYFRFANADLYPAAQLFGKLLVTKILAQLSHVMDTDVRLNSTTPPRYSEQLVAELVAEQHAKNVRSRTAPRAPSATPGSSEADAPKPIGAIFDGSWLQGFADVRRADFEEYGWLFRIYASEHGDGELEWNHSLIFRRAFAELGPDIMLPKTSRKLYDLFQIGIGSVATLAVSLNTQCFMPEILGLNLGIEATGVGGLYMDQWKQAESNGSPWKALANRLHNSIDNYADGHTKWSLAAVQSFMRRVKDTTPSEVERQWHRIWRLWRWQDILTHGTDSERAALGEHFELTSLAPT